MSDRSHPADPPLHRQAWVLASKHSWRDFVAEGRARWIPGPEAFERVLWHGGLRLGGRPLEPDHPPDSLPAGCQVVGWGFAWEPELPGIGPGSVLLDRAGLVAVDKPAWLPTQRTRASARGSLELLLRELLGSAELIAVHRLDRQTSGVVLFARTRDAARHAQRALAARRVRKRYLAWVAPVPAWTGCRVGGWMSRAPDSHRLRFALAGAPGSGGRWSETRVRVCERRDEDARVEARPITGRTHQIRVHLAALGHPILGDELYGAEGGRFDRALLHAREVSLRMPGDARPTAIEAPLPADFRPRVARPRRESADPGDGDGQPPDALRPHGPGVAGR